MDYSHRSNVFVASLWMIAISLLLFFMPVLNGIIGGAVGGYKAGSPARGMIAALLPAVIVGAGLWILLGVMDSPVLGFFAGAAGGVLVVLADVGLFIGALIGGFLANSRGHRHMPTPV